MNKGNNGKYIIGTDIGTGSTKAIAMDAKGNIIAHSQIYYSTNELHPGYSEQDPQISVRRLLLYC